MNTDQASGAVAEHEAEGLDDGLDAEHDADGGARTGSQFSHKKSIHQVVDHRDHHTDDGRHCQRRNQPLHWCQNQLFILFLLLLIHFPFLLGSLFIGHAGGARLRQTSKSQR